jgi:imidazolonepropionase-like amidohydrolase
MQRGVVASVSAHGQMQGICSHWDLWNFHQGGLTTHQTLQTATINPARALGFDKHLGSLVAGKLADLVVFNSNPLDDIRQSQNTGSMRTVRVTSYDETTLFPSQAISLEELS